MKSNSGSGKQPEKQVPKAVEATEMSRLATDMVLSTREQRMRAGQILLSTGILFLMIATWIAGRYFDAQNKELKLRQSEIMTQTASLQEQGEEMRRQAQMVTNLLGETHGQTSKLDLQTTTVSKLLGGVTAREHQSAQIQADLRSQLLRQRAEFKAQSAAAEHQLHAIGNQYAALKNTCLDLTQQVLQLQSTLSDLKKGP